MKRNESESSDSVISRELEQEVLDILDDKVPADFYTGLQQAKEGRTVLMEEALREVVT